MKSGEKTRVISFHYTLTNDGGEVLDSSSGQAPLTFLEGAGQIIPGLESALLGLLIGSKKKIRVEAAEAYGERDDNLVVKVPRDKLPAKDVEVGDQFQVGADEDGPVFLVASISGNEVTLDGNHPLAGQPLTFDVEVLEIRPATQEELDHGHAHGAGGHHVH